MGKFFQALFLFVLFVHTDTGDYVHVIKHCLAAGHKNYEAYCYIGLNTTFSCQGVPSMDPCEKASSSLDRNGLHISIGYNKSQFSFLQSGNYKAICYSPRPTTEFPPATKLIALKLEMSWPVGFSDMMSRSFGCVYNDPNITAKQVAQSKCCVDVPLEFANAFQVSISTLPYSTETGNADDSDWIRLNELNDTSSEGTELGTIKLKTFMTCQKEEGDALDDEKATSCKVEEGIPTTEEPEERNRPRTLGVKGVLEIILVLFSVTMLGPILVVILRIVTVRLDSLIGQLTKSKKITANKQVNLHDGMIEQELVRQQTEG